jgi:hypothetical protein
MIDASQCTVENLVIVKWLDHSAPSGTWHNANELESTFKDNVAETMITAGWIGSETADRYLIVSTVCVDGEPAEQQFSDVNFILKSTITEMVHSNGKKFQRQKEQGTKKRVRPSSKKKST